MTISDFGEQREILKKIVKNNVERLRSKGSRNNNDSRNICVVDSYDPLRLGRTKQ